MNYKDFANVIRSRNPDKFKDISDEDLVSAIKTRNPDKFQDIEMPSTKSEPDNSNEAQLVNKLGGRLSNITGALSGKPVYGQEGPAVLDRTVRVAGQVGGAINDVVGTAAKGYVEAAKLAPEPVKQFAKSAAKGTLSAIANIKMPSGLTLGQAVGSTAAKTIEEVERLKKQDPHLGEVIEDIANTPLNIIGAIGAKAAGTLATKAAIGSAEAAVKGAGLGVEAAGAVTKGTGEALSKVGTKTLASSMKIKDETAKLAGRNVKAGVDKIVSTISNEGIESKKGGFAGIAEKSRAKMGELGDEADKLIENFATKNPEAKVDVDKVFTEFEDELMAGTHIGVFGKEAQAADIAENALKALKLRKLSGEQPVSKLPEIKRALREGMDLFAKGKFNVLKDPVNDQVGELAYLKLKSSLEQYVPEIKAVNSRIHDLKNVETAAEQAAKRVGNKDEISLTDWIQLAQLPAVGAIAGLATGHTALGAGTGAIAAAVIGRKALSSGRGPSMAISAGRSLQKTGSNLKATGKTLSSLSKRK